MELFFWGTKTPGHIIFLIDQSASMADISSNGESFAINAVKAVQLGLENCLNSCVSGISVKDKFYVTIIGYGGTAAPCASVLLRGWASEIIAKVYESKRNGLFIIEPKAIGWTPMAEAFELARETLIQWQSLCNQSIEKGSLIHRAGSIVINVTDGEPCDGTAEAVTRAEGAALALRRTFGHEESVLLYNLHISDIGEEIMFPSDFIQISHINHAHFLYNISSVLPQSLVSLAVNNGYCIDSNSVKCMGVNLRSDSLMYLISWGSSVAISFGSSCPMASTNQSDVNSKYTSLNVYKETTFVEKVLEKYLPTVLTVRHRKSKYRDTDDDVNICVFAPGKVPRNEDMIVQVYLYTPQNKETVSTKAMVIDKNAEMKNFDILPIPIPINSKVEVQLKIEGIDFEDNRKTIVWMGNVNSCTFNVFIPSEYLRNSVVGTISMYLNGSYIGEMQFKSTIGNVSATDDLADSSAYPLRSAFVSYSHKDQKMVEGIVEGFRIVKAKYFYDRDSLKAGDMYRKKIEEAIHKVDTFVLCWSKNAAESPEVAKELDMARDVINQAKRHLNIHPILLPPIEPLPKDISDNYNYSQFPFQY